MCFLQVGYGNASGCLVIVSGFWSATVLSRRVSDLTLVTIGMLANSAGIFLMAFVTKTYMFYIGKTKGKQFATAENLPNVSFDPQRLWVQVSSWVTKE